MAYLQTSAGSIYRSGDLAIKVASKTSPMAISLFQKEIDIRKDIGNHPNIVHFHAFEETPTSLRATYDFGGRRLDEIIEGRKVSRAERRTIIVSMIKALGHLAASGYVMDSIRTRFFRVNKFGEVKLVTIRPAVKASELDIEENVLPLDLMANEVVDVFTDTPYEDDEIYKLMFRIYDKSPEEALEDPYFRGPMSPVTPE